MNCRPGTPFYFICVILIMAFLSAAVGELISPNSLLGLSISVLTFSLLLNMTGRRSGKEEPGLESGFPDESRNGDGSDDVSPV